MRRTRPPISTSGRKIFADNCAACHGDDGKGNKELGAPNLTTQVWLYGPTKADIMQRVTVGGGGVMPAWGGKLDAADDQGARGLRA